MMQNQPGTFVFAAGFFMGSNMQTSNPTHLQKLNNLLIHR